MKDVWKWLLRQWGFFPTAALLLMVVIFPSAANAQYGPTYGPHCSNGYCPPSYSSHGGYTGKYFNTKSDWVYRCWPQDHRYYYHYYTVYDHCGNWKNINDGWLYTLDSYGCYHNHCPISQYAAKPSLEPTPYVEKLGGTQVGYDVEQYTIVKKYPFLHQPGVLQGKDLPFASSPQDFLAPYETTGQLRIELAHKADMSTKDIALRVFQQESDREAKQEEVRGKLALLAETGRQDERMFAEFKEFLAVRRGQALISADAGQAKIPVDDPALAQAISTKCFSCHGGDRGVEGGIDFREADKFDREKKYAIFTSVLTGEMPKGGTALSREQSEPFRKWYEDSLLASK